MHTVEPYREAEAAIAALAEVARHGYDGAVKVMQLVPWNGQPYVASKPDGPMRQLVFGPGGAGLVSYLILEDQQRWMCCGWPGQGNERRARWHRAGAGVVCVDPDQGWERQRFSRSDFPPR